MAYLLPSLEKIKQLKPKPEEGELHLLNFLSNSLDDSYEVFFNPYMNGDRPDIVIMRKGHGVLIIEVKDYRLSSYELDKDKNWVLKKTRDVIKSPIEQVLKYKENLFELHIDKLLEMKIKNSKYFGVVYSAIYFHNATSTEVDCFFHEANQDEKYKNFINKNVDLIGRDNLNKDFISSLLNKRYIGTKTKSQLFTDDLYKSFKRFLTPPLHLAEQGKSIYYDKEQIAVISESKIKQRHIKGIAGSGKTTVLAAKAVESHKRNNSNVLILTFNITLRNLIHDKISDVRETFPWDVFTITNYHQFINSQLNNLSIPIKRPQEQNLNNEQLADYWERNYYSNKDLFIKHKDEIALYKTILIDEIQDYKKPWMDILKDCFLDEQGEYIVFSDVKQNIYQNKTLNKDVDTNIIGRPKILNMMYRSDSKISDFAIQFQKQLFVNKYEIDNINTEVMTIEAFQDEEKEGNIDYYFFDQHERYEKNIGKIYSILRQKIINDNIHPNDIAVIGDSIKMLQYFDAFYRHASNEKTTTTFESIELLNKIVLDKLRLDGAERCNINKDTYVLQDGISQKSREILQQIINMHHGFDIQNFIKDAMEIVNNKNNKKQTNQAISIMITICRLYNNSPDTFSDKLNSFSVKYHLNKSDIIDFSTTYKNILNIFLNTEEIDLNEIHSLRRNKKYHFHMNTGLIKISSIHSFKGRESKYIFLLLGAKNITDEVVYTGITRCRDDLTIFNNGNYDLDYKLKKLISSGHD
jgi:hypothetical protein